MDPQIIAEEMISAAEFDALDPTPRTDLDQMDAIRRELINL